jgi:hypothetical protein
MKTESSKLDNGDLEIKLTFDEHDQICLSHDLMSIEEWFYAGPSAGKIHSCRARMIKLHQDELLKSEELQKMTMAEVNKILSDPVKICKMISEMHTYKNRIEREKTAV